MASLTSFATLLHSSRSDPHLCLGCLFELHGSYNLLVKLLHELPHRGRVHPREHHKVLGRHVPPRRGGFDNGPAGDATGMLSPFGFPPVTLPAAQLVVLFHEGVLDLLRLGVALQGELPESVVHCGLGDFPCFGNPLYLLLELFVVHEELRGGGKWSRGSAM